MTTAQEVFDHVVNHFRRQGRPAIHPLWAPDSDAYARCVYRTADGNKCAVGCLIPDEKYDPSFEGQSVYEPKVLAATGLAREFLPLLSSLQTAHDDLWWPGVDGAEQFINHLGCIAKNHHLSFTPPDVSELAWSKVGNVL